MLSNSLLKFAANEDWYVYKDGEYTFGEINGFPITAKTDDILTSFFVPLAGIAPENLIELTGWLENTRFSLKLVDYEMTDNFIAIRAKDTAFSGSSAGIGNFLRQLTEQLALLDVDPNNCAICGLEAEDKALYVGYYCHLHPECVEKEGIDFTLPAQQKEDDDDLILLTEDEESADIVDEAVIDQLAESFEAEQEGFLRDLASLCAINSVDGEPTDDAPYGEKTKEALDLFLQMADRMGFHTVNVDQVAGYAEMGSGDEMVAAVCHLDIVPAGSGWDTDPFELVQEGDKLIARGVMDDKGPAVCVLYAMKSLKEDPTFQPDKRIRLIVGLNEEKGSACMAHYAQVEEIPTAGFTADAVFPAIYAEKGNAVIHLVQARGESDMIAEAQAGEAVNMVPGECHVTLKDEAPKTYLGSIAHASTPHLGLNAISVAMEKLAKQIAEKGQEDRFVSFYNDLIAYELNGERIGLQFEDGTGETTVNAGLLSIDDREANLVLNIRYPVTFDLEQAKERLNEIVAPYGVEASWPGVMPPLSYAKDSSLISTLMGVYRDLTKTDAEPLAIGGGTYARALPNIVGFGPAFPGDPDIAHQANEWGSLKRLLAGAALYREALRRLSMNS